MECSNCHKEIKEKQEVCLSCGHILRYESEDSKKCVHCERRIPIAYKKCPYCKKKQSSNRSFFKNILFIVISIFITNYCIQTIISLNELENKSNYDKYYDNVTYEELVRRNKYYDEAFIKFYGKIETVEKIGNLNKLVKISLYVEENKDNKITVYYNNVKSIGFMKNDLVVVYGKYKKIEGNIPRFNAQLIEIVNP